MRVVWGVSDPRCHPPEAVPGPLRRGSLSASRSLGSPPTCRRRFVRPCNSRTSPAGGSPARCFGSSGATSISKPGSSAWTRIPRRTTRGRTFPFTDALERLLEAEKAEHERLKAEGVICPWVFNRSNRKVKGKRITTFIKAFRAACTKAGCPGRIPHDLRRTAVRNLVRAGVPERVAMQMTGHKTRSVFERYHIVSGCDLVDAAKKLNALQPAALPPEGGSHMSDRDGLASPKPRSGEVGHNSGTAEPDRCPSLTVSL
jgi:integrase-like protein